LTTARPLFAFDLDGTLVDSAGDLARALNGALRDLGLAPYPIEVVRTFIGEGSRRLMERALERHRRLDLTDELLVRFRARYEHGFLTGTRPFPGIVGALEVLAHRATLAVCTNKPAVFARPMVAALLPGLFAAVIGPDDVGALKPDPAMLRLAERMTGARATAFVGDSAIDLETARRAGVRAIGVTWGLTHRFGLSGADTLVDVPDELCRTL
jgi:phosphoglycolate phosphatase